MLNAWLVAFMGVIGTGSLLVAAVMAYLIIVFNYSFRFSNPFKSEPVARLGEKKDHPDDSQALILNNRDELDSINTIKEEEDEIDMVLKEVTPTSAMADLNNEAIVPNEPAIEVSMKWRFRWKQRSLQ